MFHIVRLSLALGDTSQIGVAAAFKNLGKPWGVIGQKTDAQAKSVDDPKRPVKRAYQIGSDSVFYEIKHCLNKTYASNTLRAKPGKCTYI
ncbi:hypothetical protein KW841_24875 [Pseudomonas sp. PDM28]|uniref:hypothetical protein n=1 Tax=Pseudomonas sp. PDM28 TaxID=2854770 RepID=UPI001C469065|nr:hypothetical protein [Pseudomonas sp. PDM28]MBV7555587.1 hypothetical protein [Pseudomonas sp. PDM28]